MQVIGGRGIYPVYWALRREDKEQSFKKGLISELVNKLIR
jgi:hypothetical protein